MTLDLPSRDRITETETVYEFDGTDWWRKTTNRTYATGGAALNQALAAS